MKDLVVNDVDRTLLNNDKQLWSNYLIALDKVLENSRANDREAAVIVIENEWKTGRRPADRSLYRTHPLQGKAGG